MPGVAVAVTAWTVRESVLVVGRRRSGRDAAPLRPPAPDRVDLEVVRGDLRAPARGGGRHLTRRSPGRPPAVVSGRRRARADHPATPADAPLGAPDGKRPRAVVARPRRRAGGRRDGVGAGRAVLVLEHRLRRARVRARGASGGAVPRASPPARAGAARDARIRRQHRGGRPEPARGRARRPPSGHAVASGLRARDRAVRAVRGRVRQHPVDGRRHGPLRPPPARPRPDRVRPDDRRRARRRGRAIRPRASHLRARRPHRRRPLRGDGRLRRADAVRHGR